MFFAVLSDIEPLIRDVESINSLTYYKTGLLDKQDMRVYHSLFELPNLGITSSGDWNKIENFLVVKTDTNIVAREVPQRTGGVKYAIDQMVNPKSIEIKVGGVYSNKENVIVAGRIATISTENDSNELYKLFTGKLKKSFTRIGSFYVGKFAETRLREGWRLVTNERSPKEYDLTIDT